MDLTNLNKERKARRPGPEINSLMYGKVPPQARDLEGAILGAIMLEKGVIDTVIDLLPVEAFYVEANQRIYQAIRHMYQGNRHIDMMTVVEELRTMEQLDLVGGPYYISVLTNSVVSSAGVERHSRIILQMYMKRELIRIGGQMVNDAYEDSTDVFDLLDETETSIFGLSQNFLKNDFNHISKGLVKAVERIEMLRKLDESVTGVPSGYTELDKITHGWQPGDLIIIAARPSVGKTSFALNLARKASMHQTKPTGVGFFSLEMSEQQLVTRLISSESNVVLKKISSGRLEDGQMKTLYDKGVRPLSYAPIYIDDRAAITIFELRAKVRRMKNKHNVGLIIIDYLQLMSGPKEQKNGNREQEISKISRDLKAMAKDLNLPVIALSQLSREVEKRTGNNKIPQLSDLRESGAIEQDADQVLFLYRPSEDDVKADLELANKGSVRIAKNRNGELNKLGFRVDNSVQQWDEMGLLSDTGSNYIPINQANQDQNRLHIPKGTPLNNYYDKDNDEEDLPF